MQWGARLHDILSVHEYLDVEAAEQNIRKNVRFRGMNVWILVCAIVIASIGLNVNSTAVIIGAMLISPLMGPIIGFGLALGTNNIPLLRSSLSNLVVMVLISIIASTLFFLISPLNLQNQSELLARTTPTIYDVLIAFVGGAAGALETSRKEKGTVISGVAIATALMPPLCTVGYGLANFDFHFVWGAFYLFFINCTFVALATFLVVKYLRYPMVKDGDPEREGRLRFWFTLLILVVVVPSIFSAISVVKENNFNTKAARFVEENKSMGGTIIYDYSTQAHSKTPTITLRLAGRALTDQEREYLLHSVQLACGITASQVIIEESDFVKDINGGSEFEKQVYTDLNSQLSALKEKLRRYESDQIPYGRINAEVQALYPQIEKMELAQGEKSVYAVISYVKPDTGNEYEHVSDALENWLKIRLGKAEVIVIER